VTDAALYRADGMNVPGLPAFGAGRLLDAASARRRRFSAESLCEVFRIPRIAEAEVNPKQVIRSCYGIFSAQFFAALPIKLDHRVEVITKAVFR